MRNKGLCLAIALSLIVTGLFGQSGSMVQAKTKVSLSKTSVVLIKGKTTKLNVKGAKKATYQWKTNNKKVVSIVKGAKLKNVVIKGVKKGQTKVICVVKQKSKKKITLSVKVKVKQKTTSTTTPKVTPKVTPTATPMTTPMTTPIATPTIPTATPATTPAVTATPDYSMKWNVAIDKDSTSSTAVKDNQDGTSTVTFPSDYSTILFPLGDKDSYDMSDYQKLQLDLTGTTEIRVSLFNSKGVNVKPPTSGTAEWSQWNYVGKDGIDGWTDIDITSNDLSDVAYVAISSCAGTEPVTLRKVQLYSNDYRLTLDAQYKKLSVESSAVADQGDNTTLVTFPGTYQNLDFPIGEEDSYNLSQYSQLVMKVNCSEQFRVTLCDNKGNNIQPASTKDAEWSQWWYVGSGGIDGEITCDFSSFSKEDLAKTAYIRVCATETTCKPLTICGLTFKGDARVEKYIPIEEESGPQDPYTENLKLTTSYSEFKDTIYNNPLITQDYIADPTSIEYNGRLYVFGTNDVVEFDNKNVPVDNGYDTQKIKIISSADMVNWRDEGTIDVSKITDYATHSWAPTICKNEVNGQTKFFLYYTTGGDGIAVLEADTPTGEWTDPLGKTLVNHSTTNCSSAEVPWCFDPSVLVDDDGSAYLYFGGSPDTASGKETSGEHPKSARVVKLGSDMISLDGDPQEMDLKWYFEDNEINKIGDTYYFSYCTNWSVKDDETTGACCIAYMTSKDPMTGWEYQGQIFANPGSVFGNYYNNHHNMTQFKGEWYILYHTTILEEAQYGTKKGYRSLNVDNLNWTDGVPSATATYTSVSQVADYNPFALNSAAEMAWNGGLTTTSINVASGSAMVLDSINTGDWFGVSQADFSSESATKLSLSMAGITTEGYIEVYLDAPSVAQGGTSVAKLELVNTGTLDTYQTISANLTSTISGKHNIYFVFRGVGYRVANWIFS